MQRAGMRIVFEFDRGQLRNIRALVQTVDEQRMAGDFIARIASAVQPLGTVVAAVAAGDANGK